MRTKMLLLSLLSIAAKAHAQTVILPPEIGLTGNIGCVGYPCLNNGTLIMDADANRTMTAQESSATGGIKVTSSVALTATRNLILPAGNFQFLAIENATLGGMAIQVIGPTGTGVTIPNGSSATVWFDGTNMVQTGTAVVNYGQPFTNATTVIVLPSASLLSTPNQTHEVKDAAGNALFGIPCVTGSDGTYTCNFAYPQSGTVVLNGGGGGGGASGGLPLTGGTLTGPLIAPLVEGNSLFPTNQPPVTTTCSSTTGSANLVCATGAGIVKNMSVYPASGFPTVCDTPQETFTSLYVTSTVSGITVSCPATATNAAVSVTFGDVRTDPNAALLENSIQTNWLLVGGASQNQYFAGLGNPNSAPFQASSGAYGLAAAFGAATSANTLGLAGTRPINCFIQVDSWPGAPGPQWCEYLQSNLYASSANLQEHLQVESSVNSNWPKYVPSPYIDNDTNETINFRLDCGTGQTSPNNPSPCSAAMDIVYNGAPYEAGIKFGQNSLDTASQNIPAAVLMATNQGVEWDYAAGSISTRLFADGNHTFQMYSANGFGLESSLIMEPTCFFAGCTGSGSSNSNVLAFNTVYNGGAINSGYITRIAAPVPYIQISDPVLTVGGQTACLGNGAGCRDTNGIAALSSGTVTVSTPSACAVSGTCTYQLTHCGLGGSTAVGTLTTGNITVGTSFVINSVNSAGAVVTGDSSLTCWKVN